MCHLMFPIFCVILNIFMTCKKKNLNISMICLKFSVCKSLMIWNWWTDIIVNHIDNCSDIICNIIDITLNNWHHKWAHWYHVWEKCLLFPDVLSLCHEDLWVLLKKNEQFLLTLIILFCRTQEVAESGSQEEGCHPRGPGLGHQGLSPLYGLSGGHRYEFNSRGKEIGVYSFL